MNAPAPFPYKLFEVIGIELEYMIVNRETLDVLPVADAVMEPLGGGYDREVDLGELAWSNELALHVLEMKTNGPVQTLSGLAGTFQTSLVKADGLLESLGGRLLPSAMHPWMDPERELVLWPHEDNAIYQAFHRIFDCRGHGWANLQSMHINLPFANHEEFGRLHAAIRLVLPILPALAASSPFVQGSATGLMDSRLDAYRHNADRVPSVTAGVIPEPVFTIESYERDLLGGIYRDMESLDPEGILRYEWVNARGAIARFDRGALEIRVLDVQECPQADLAIASAIVAVLRALVGEEFTSYAEQQTWSQVDLGAILDRVIVDADHAVIENAAYLRSLGFAGATATAAEVWRDLIDRTLAPLPEYEEWSEALTVILDEGCLARRMVRGAGDHPDQPALRRVAEDLATCLTTGRLYRP